MKRPPRERLLMWFLWLVCGFSLAGALSAALIPLGGVNRTVGVAIPFGLAAGAAAGLALAPRVERALSLVLYGVAALALTYGLMSLAALPMRLTVLGTCPPAPQVCPPGFEPAMTVGETLGTEAAITLGILALVLVVAAMEVRYQPRLRVLGRSSGQPAAQVAAPPPEMKPSAIVKPRPATPEPEEKTVR